MTDRWNQTDRRRYVCRRVGNPLELSGPQSDSGWDDVPASESFVDITGDSELEPRFETRVQMAWDDSFFYFRAVLDLVPRCLENFVNPVGRALLGTPFADSGSVASPIAVTARNAKCVARSIHARPNNKSSVNCFLK